MLEKNLHSDLISNSESFRRVLKLAEVLSRKRSHAVLLGERGSGKEYMAKYIHAQSPYSKAPFISVACEKWSKDQLIDLFCKPGPENVIAQAGQGLLYLKEPQYLPRAAQEALLATIIANDAEPQATGPRVFIGIRFENATQTQHLLLPELYYRLKQFVLEIPALRERSEDLGALAQIFVKEYSQQSGKERQLGEAALQSLQQHGWSENLDELKKVITYACERASGSTIEPSSLPAEYTSESASISLDEVEDLHELEKRMYTHVFRRCGSDPRKAAEKLGIGLSTFYRKMRQYSLSRS